MSVYLGRLRRYGAWALIAAGGLLVVHTLLALSRASARDVFLDNHRYGLDGFNPPFHSMDAHQVGTLLAEGRTDEALAVCDAADHRRGPRSTAVLRARIRIQTRTATDDALLAFTGRNESPGVWLAAVEQLLEARKARRDVDGAAALLKGLVSGRVWNSALDPIPFPYLEHWAAFELAKLYRDAGDGREGHAWARRAKHDFPVFYDWMCSDPNQIFHEDLEGLLVATARQQGLTYTAEPFDHDVLARRSFGPTWVEGAIGIGIGFAIAFAGVCVLTGSFGAWPGNAISWRIFWSRRGALGRIGWGCYTAGFAGCMILVAKPLLGGRLSADGQFWLGLLSLAFCAVLVPFLGCFIAAPEATPAPGVRRRHFPPRLA